jgi:hypothetical protein
MDSLLAVEIRNVLARRVGDKLPATLAFDHPSVGALTRLCSSGSAPPARAPPPRSTASAPARARSRSSACRSGSPAAADDLDRYWELLLAARPVASRGPRRSVGPRRDLPGRRRRPRAHQRPPGLVHARPVRLRRARSSASPTPRPGRSIRSSASCSRWAGRPSRTPASPSTASATRAPACTSASRRRTGAPAMQGTESSPYDLTGSDPVVRRRPRGVRARPARPGDDREHGVFVVAGGDAPRGARRCRPATATGAGRRREPPARRRR